MKSHCSKKNNKTDLSQDLCNRG